MHTDPDMNEKIVEELRSRGSDNPVLLYAALRIEELEAENTILRAFKVGIDAGLLYKQQSSKIDITYQQEP